MIQRRTVFVSFVCVLLFACISFAQPETKEAKVEPSFDTALYLVVGSNDVVQGAALPSDLAGVSKQIKSNFGFSNYRLASTFLGRIANHGNFEYKSPTNVLGQDMTSQSQFLDWSITDLRTLPTEKGATGFQARTFRFGARIPIATGDGGKTVMYEPIGLNLTQVGLVENRPTLIGTLNLPGASGTIFLIMTVRSVD